MVPLALKPHSHWKKASLAIPMIYPITHLPFSSHLKPSKHTILNNTDRTFMVTSHRMTSYSALSPQDQKVSYQVSLSFEAPQQHLSTSMPSHRKVYTSGSWSRESPTSSHCNFRKKKNQHRKKERSLTRSLRWVPLGTTTRKKIDPPKEHPHVRAINPNHHNRMVSFPHRIYNHPRRFIQPILLHTTLRKPHH